MESMLGFVLCSSKLQTYLLQIFIFRDDHSVLDVTKACYEGVQQTYRSTDYKNSKSIEHRVISPKAVIIWKVFTDYNPGEECIGVVLKYSCIRPSRIVNCCKSCQRQAVGDMTMI